MALGSRLRRLGDVLMADALQIYKMYDVELDPRWFPVFYMLTQKHTAGITELAEDIGQSHPAVSQVISAMKKQQLVENQKCTQDARVNKVTLTPKGKSIAEKLAKQCQDVERAIEGLFQDANCQLWFELDAIERQLENKSLQQRVTEVNKQSRLTQLQILPYQNKHQQGFKRLNQHWIEQYFQMEECDLKALDHPMENIINPGGYIAIALYQQQVVGTCALIRIEDGFELAKMAVDDSVKGLGIGQRLGEHVIQQARTMGANRLYLESNTQLTPAINLYRKLGFKKLTNQPSPYERCDIQMELRL